MLRSIAYVSMFSFCYNHPTQRMFVPTHPTQQMFGAVPLVWICNPDPLSIRIFNSQKQRPDPTDAVVEPYVVADYL